MRNVKVFFFFSFFFFFLSERVSKKCDKLTSGRTFQCVRDRFQISGLRTKEVAAALRSKSKDRVRWTTLPHTHNWSVGHTLSNYLTVGDTSFNHWKMLAYFYVSSELNLNNGRQFVQNNFLLFLPFSRPLFTRVCNFLIMVGYFFKEAHSVSQRRKGQEEEEKR